MITLTVLFAKAVPLALRVTLMFPLLNALMFKLSAEIIVEINSADKPSICFCASINCAVKLSDLLLASARSLAKLVALA